MYIRVELPDSWDNGSAYWYSIYKNLENRNKLLMAFLYNDLVSYKMQCNAWNKLLILSVDKQMLM